MGGCKFSYQKIAKIEKIVKLGHHQKMPMLANFVNSDLKKDFTVPQVAEKHGWPESLVWSLKLEEENDVCKCHELQ